MFYPLDNNIIAIGREDSSIQIYNVLVDEVGIEHEYAIPCLHESQSIGKTHYIWFVLEMHLIFRLYVPSSFTYVFGYHESVNVILHTFFLT